MWTWQTIRPTQPLPATSTGSIIKRRRNNLALDVMGADAFSVILDHVQQMERWAAFAEFNRDLNTLLSLQALPQPSDEHVEGVYGGGKTLWKNFRNVCSMAAGAYRPPIAQLDKAAVNIAKGVTAAKVSFRSVHRAEAVSLYASLPFGQQPDIPCRQHRQPDRRMEMVDAEPAPL